MMSDDNKYLTFQQTHDTGRTKVWAVCSASGDTKLGEVRWYAPWRRYCLYVSQDIVLDANCMRAIIQFIELEMERRRS